MKKILVGMSGGVDSSAATILLKKDGYEVAGCTLKLLDGVGHTENVKSAREACEKIGIKHYEIDLTSLFAEKVIDNFISSYELGETPNPCIVCNKFVKFGAMLDKAFELGFDGIATGHYAKKSYDEKTGLYNLVRASDRKKDQSYVLYNMTQHELSHTLFPLFERTKDQNRELVKEYGISCYNKPDSQDICFVPSGDYCKFIEDYTKKTFTKGNFIDTSGNILAKHDGIIRYTIGQRKGLGVAFGKPVFVCAKNCNDNTVTLGEISDLLRREVTAENVNIISGEKIDGAVRVTAKTRYNMNDVPATLTIDKQNRAVATFDEPVKAVAKGQSLVFYDGDILIGGGVIIS